MDWLGQLGPYQGFAYRTLGWWFLPGFATNALISVYYNVLPQVGMTHWIPPSDSPKRPQHYRRAFALVVLSYLAYNLVNDIIEQPPSFYTLLGVPTHASDGDIKSAYRMFAKRNHPDRVGATGAPMFILVRDAYEGLKHPIKRYGYDRFGFDALDWKVAENPHAMLYRGLENAMYYYVPTGVIMAFLAIFGWGGHSTYWRATTWALVAMLETCIIIGFNPFSSIANPFSALVNLAPILGRIPLSSKIPSMPPYQWVFFLRQLFVTSAIAIGQVLPVLSPPPPTAKEEKSREAEIARLAIALDPVVRQIIVHSHISDQEAKETLVKEIQYLDTDTPTMLPGSLRLTEAHQQALAALKPSIQRLFVQNILLKDPELRSSYVSAVERTRQPKSHHRALQDRLTPTPEETETSARLLAIPSPPSSVFSLSREPTPEFKPLQTNLMFDVSTPGFNYQPSPSRPSPSRSNFSTPRIRRRPSMSPSKRSSISLNTTGRSASEGIPFSPTSPVAVKQELA